MKRTVYLTALLLIPLLPANASQKHSDSHLRAPRARKAAPVQPNRLGLNRPYRLVDAQTCAAVAGPTRTNEYECVEETSRFLAAEPVHLWAKFEGIQSRYQYQIKTFRGDQLIRQAKSAWNPRNQRSVASFLVMKEVNTLPGEYRSELYINVGQGFELVATREYGVEVLSPVEGRVRRQCYWPAEDDVWAFCAHAKTGRYRSRGVAMADDRKALDVNLRDYADAGKPVYPVAPGKVVKYGGQYLPGQGRFAGVLLEHSTESGERWWSGYLHMRRDSIRLRVGQLVDVDQPIGRVGHSGTSNSHLHFVLYHGENTRSALRSFEADFRARTGAEMRRLARRRISDQQG